MKQRSFLAWFLAGVSFGGSCFAGCSYSSMTIVNSSGGSATICFQDSSSLCTVAGCNTYGTGGGHFSFFGSGGIVTAETASGSVALSVSPSTYTAGVSATFTIGGAGGGGGGGSMMQTNCVTVMNAGDQPLYFNFSEGIWTATGGAQTQVSNTVLGGCGAKLSVGGAPGSTGGQGEYMAVYPGEMFTVCETATVPSGDYSFVQANQAPSSAYPCGLQVGQPRCVTLCTGDNVAYGGSGDSPVAFGSSATNVSPVNPLLGGTNLPLGGFFASQGDTNSSAPGGTNQVANMVWGFNGVIAAVNANTASAQVDSENIIGSIDSNGVFVAHAISNLLGVSNVFGTNLSALTNLAGLNNLTNFPTNYPDAAVIAFLNSNWSGLAGVLGSNGFGVEGTGGTNMGVAFSAAWSNVAGGLVVPSDSLGSGGEQIDIPDPYSASGHQVMDISETALGVAMPSFETWFSLARNVGAWVVVLLTFVALLHEARAIVDKLFAQRQMTGSSEEAFGFNASLPTGLAYCALFAALLASIPVAVAAWLTATSQGASSVNSLGGAYSTVSASSMWHLCTELVPIDTVVASFFSYVGFAYLYGPILLVGLRSVVLWWVVGLAVCLGCVSNCDAMTIQNLTGFWVTATVGYTNLSGTPQGCNAVFSPGTTVLEQCTTVLPLAVYTNQLCIGTATIPSGWGGGGTIWSNNFDPPVTLFFYAGAPSVPASVIVGAYYGFSNTAWFMDGFYFGGALVSLWAAMWAYKRGIAPVTDFR